MRAAYEIERDDFDQWIGWALAASYRHVQPPERVWERIVRRIASSDDPGKHRRWERTNCPARQRVSGQF